MAARIHNLVLKIAERCNLNCSYCYMYNHADAAWRTRPTFMSDPVFDAVVDRIDEYCDAHCPHAMGVSFHGGEPTLVGPERLRSLARRLRLRLGERLVDIALQTNATLIDDAFLQVVAEEGIKVGVSLDGPPEVHDRFRVDHAGRGSYAATVRGLEKLRAAGLAPGVLCVVNPGLSGLEVYRHFRGLGVDRMSFLLPDVSYDSKSRFYAGFGATPVADFLIPIFDEWFGADDPQVHVGPFWSLIGAMFGGFSETDAFGNPLLSYLVIETDGSIRAPDALRVCAEGIDDSGLNVMQAGFDDLTQGLPFLDTLVHEGAPLCGTCLACPERRVCGGGYLPHRYSSENGFDNPSVWCDDIWKLLSHMRSVVADAGAA